MSVSVVDVRVMRVAVLHAHVSAIVTNLHVQWQICVAMKLQF